MAQRIMETEEIVNSFYLALENGRDTAELDLLAEELREFGVSEPDLLWAQQEASRLFAKNCF